MFTFTFTFIFTLIFIFNSTFTFIFTLTLCFAFTLLLIVATFFIGQFWVYLWNLSFCVTICETQTDIYVAITNLMFKMLFELCASKSCELWVVNYELWSCELELVENCHLGGWHTKLEVQIYKCKLWRLK